MKILEWLKQKMTRAAPQNRHQFSSFPFYFGSSISGNAVDEKTAMRNSAVYSCVKILSESVASLPLHVYRYTDGGKEKAVNHPLYFLLHNAPNEEMTAFVFLETTMAHLLLWGNSYAQILKNRAGQVIGLYPLLPSKMTVERNDGGELEYRYRRFTEENPNFKDKGEIILPRAEILHVAGLGFDGLIGYSPIAMAKNAIGLSIACENFGSKFFANGARPLGILKTPTLVKHPEKLQESWQSMYGGENAGKVAILEQGMEYETISIPPDDAQFLQTRKFQIAEIARIFRVPLHFLNELDRATFSNITQQSLEFVMYTLTPWLTRLEQALNKSLFSASERGKYFVKFNLAGLLRGDYESRVKGYCQMIQNGVMSINDVRELEDLNKIPAETGGDLHIVNGNFIKLEDAGIYAQKKAGGKND